MTEWPDDVLIRLDPTEPIRLRTSDMRRLAEITGKTWTELFEEGDGVDKIQVMAFFKLRQSNRAASAAELWKIADDAEVEITGPGVAVPPDPSGAAS
jgi:hypothetical protein